MFAFARNYKIKSITPVVLANLLVYCLLSPVLARTYSRSAESAQAIHTSPTISKAEIIKKLRLSRFDGLEVQFVALLETYNDARRQLKAAAEKDLVLAFSAFQYGDPNLTPQYNRWVHRSPGKLAPLLARAIHFWRLGWFARGTQWGSKTSPKRFEEMESYFRQSHNDLLKVLKINSKLSIAWGYRLNMMNTLSQNVSWQSGGLEKLYYNASAHAPESVFIPDNYFLRLQPRWGGSRTRILTALERLKLLRTNVQSTKYLFGFLHYSIGRDALSRKRYAKALKAFWSASQFGTSRRYLIGEALAHYGLKNYKHALIAIGRAEQEAKQSSQIHALKARILWKLGRRNTALDVWEKASGLSPYDPGIGHWYGYALRKKGYFKKALFILKRSQYFGLENHEIYALQGDIQLYHTGNFRQAALNFSRARELAPNDINYLFSQGSSLVMAKQVDKGAPILRQYAKFCNSPVHQCRKNQLSWVNNTYCISKKDKKSCGIRDNKKTSFTIRFLKWLY